MRLMRRRDARESSAPCARWTTRRPRVRARRRGMMFETDGTLGAVGVYFGSEGGGGARDAAETLSRRLAAAHASAMDAVEDAVREAGAEARSFREEVMERAVGVTVATKELVRAAFEGTGGEARRATGAVWEASKAFETCPKDPTRAIGARLMRCATFVKDVSDELMSLGEDEVMEDDEDDLRFGDDDFDEEETKRGKELAKYSKACIALLKALILPTVKETSVKIDALEPIVEACAEFQSAVEEIGVGAYPPQDLEQLRASVAECARAGRTMHACVRDAGIGEKATDDSLAAFNEATVLVEKSLQDGA